MKRLAYFILILFVATAMSGQQKDSIADNKYFIWDFVGMGFKQDLNKMSDDDIVSNFVLYKNKKIFHWQIVSFDYIFYNNFGVNYGIEANKNSDKNEIARRIDGQILRQNPDLFIYKTFTNLRENNNKLFGSVAQKLGVSYLIRYNKLFIVSRLSIKNFTLTYDYYTAILKQKNTNNYIKVVYNPDKEKKNIWGFNPSASIKYLLNKYAMAKLDFGYLLYQPKLTYEYEKTDIFNDNVLESKNIDCIKSVHQLYLRLGVAFLF